MKNVTSEIKLKLTTDMWNPLNHLMRDNFGQRSSALNQITWHFHDKLEERLMMRIVIPLEWIKNSL